jgi:hypothetical protein
MWFQRLRAEGAGSRSPLLRGLPYHHNSTAVDPKLIRTPKHKVKPQGYTDTYLPLDYREGITDSRLVRGLLWVGTPPPFGEGGPPDSTMHGIDIMGQPS